MQSSILIGLSIREGNILARNRHSSPRDTGAQDLDAAIAIITVFWRFEKGEKGNDQTNIDTYAFLCRAGVWAKVFYRT